MPQFSHLHVHTQFSLLDGAADIGKLYKKAIADNMPAIAITDHGNMFGAFSFVAEAYKNKKDDGTPKVKPIVGCEFYVVEDRHRKSFSKDDRDVRCHQLFLAKNEQGYKNLVKMCSLGYIEGMYSKYPRIDKELILKYHEGLIATTCCIGAEVPRTILKKGAAEGEKVFKWWLDLFGEDYYVELQRHDIPEQIKVNEVLLEFAAKHNVKVIASNDSHYVDREDWNAHDILLCINTGEKKSTPTMKEFSDDDNVSKGKRFAFYNDQFYFKKQEEMLKLFSDIPQAIDNTNEIVGKVELLDLKRDILLPAFPLPIEFTDQMTYLRHLTFEGARKRYGTIDEKAEDRLNFELSVIERMGFAGYFLIVSDFIKAGRELGVFIGPGRGSAAGSAVAYCIGITNIDPIKYDLLFERFLNPERASMPDIDTDFDDEGRQKVIDYVVDKYGKNQVAQIITYGSMAAKMSIKDVARVMDLPLSESNLLAKLVPERPGIKLNRLIKAPIDGDGGLKQKEGLQGEDIENVKKLREIHDDTGTLQSMVLKEALILEGSVRNTGVHASAIIIAPSDLTDLLPIAVAKDSNLYVTQYEGSVIEDAGVIKMDFLGLKTLTIIRDALQLIKENYEGLEIDIDLIPLDDKKTYELYQKGDTNGTFQFESDGMKKHMRDLKPDKFEDLIAMNALYRPGPMEYIPNYIKRKHGLEPVQYDLPEMEEFLSETYGITVYQEQVMLLSQKLAGFSKGEADKLRKAMGKKDRKTLDYMKPKFIEGANAKGMDPKKLEKIWTDWEAFASYAFNKSHSTCYAFVAFQTAYLKAHYTAEFMASNLTNNLANMDKISYFMEECKRIGVPVLGPDVNESKLKFTVNKKGQIRFGLAAIKGVGEAAVESLVTERENNGPFTSIFDFVRRVSLRAVSKKTMESLAIAGAFDGLHGNNRAIYFYSEATGKPTFLETIVRYGQNVQEGKGNASTSLFGDSEEEISVPEPQLPKAEPWHVLEMLDKEKQAVGIYLSGHPLDDFKREMRSFIPFNEMDNLEPFKNKSDLKSGGIIISVSHRMTKAGKPFGSFVMEDFSGSKEFVLFSEKYLQLKHYLEVNQIIYLNWKTTKSFRDPDAQEIMILSMGITADLKDKYTQLSITLHESDLNETYVSTITDLLLKHPGKCKLKINLVSQDASMNVNLISSTMKIDANSELLAEMEKLVGDRFTLN